MRILVLNSGSSSLKFSVFDATGPGDPRPEQDGEIDGIGGASPKLKLNGKTEDAQAANPEEALDAVFIAMTRSEIDTVGYRVVHPGATVTGHQRITPELLRELGKAVAFAPLHDPTALDVIHEGMRRFPALPHFACFDTEFHRTMPVEATTYPLPEPLRHAGVRRYGFHGLSCESVVRQLAAGPGVPQRMVIAHLGSGCSVTALLDGKSVDTSMGLTPTGGVVMGTRPGDLDPGVVLYLLRQPDASADTLEHMLNHDAGVAALSGMANDFKAVRQAADGGSAEAALALSIFTRSITKTIGSFAWLLGGLDAIVFTGGIGEHDPTTRAAILPAFSLDASPDALKAGGVRRIDASRSDASRSDASRSVASNSDTAIYVISAQEDLMIAVHVARMMSSA